MAFEERDRFSIECRRLLIDAEAELHAIRRMVVKFAEGSRSARDCHSSLNAQAFPLKSSATTDHHL